jgi:hypothetical protein
MDYSLIYIVHMLIVFPLLAYPFIAQKYLDVKSFDNYFLILFIIGLVVFLYHGYKFYLTNKY